MVGGNRGRESILILVSRRLSHPAIWEEVGRNMSRTLKGIWIVQTNTRAMNSVFQCEKGRAEGKGSGFKGSRELRERNQSPLLSTSCQSKEMSRGEALLEVNINRGRGE